MKRNVGVVGFVLAVSLAMSMIMWFGGACADARAGGLTRISDSVWAYAGVPSGSPGNRFGANAGIVVGEDAVLVVDTLTSAREAEQFVRDIRAVTDKPIRYVVDTHYHLDHALGNCVFADLGARIIAHRKCREAMLEAGGQILDNPGAYGLEPDFWNGTRAVAPDIVFEREMDVDLGGRMVRIIHGGAPSHSAGSVMVIVPDQGVIFTGDILFTDFHPFLGEGDMAGWARNLDLIESLDMPRIIPGHGPLSGKKDLDDMREYLVVFDAQATELAKTMADPDAMAAEMLKRLPPRKDGAFLVGANIQMRYAPKTEAQ